jgi:hypothetical protein
MEKVQMQSFKHSLSEGAMGYADVFKRNNKVAFIDKAVKGELVDTNGKKLPPVDPNSELIGFLNRNDAENNKQFQDVLTRTYGSSLTKLSIDKIENGFSTQGAGVASGADWENIITSHYNRLSGNEGYDSDADSEAEKFDDWHNDTGEKLAQSFIKEIGKSPMQQFGKGKSKANLSNFWLSHGGTDGTPKTDMYNNSYNISLKKAGGSQLASGAKGETVATYNAALEYLGSAGVTPEMEKILKMIEEGFQKVATKHTVGELDKLSKKSKSDLKPEDAKAVAQFTETQKFHTELNKELKKYMNFEKQPEFLKWYTYEAMSGYKKFSLKQAAASVCMEFNADKGTVSKFIEVTADGRSSGLTDNPSVGSKVIGISSKVKVYAAYKSGGGNPYSTLRLGLAEDNQSFDETLNLAGIIREEIINDKICNMLVEDRYQLDEFAIVKKAFGKLKKMGKDVKIWFGNLLTRIMERVKVVFDKIKNMGSKMYEALFGFLNIKVDKVKASMPKELEGFI